MRVINDLSTCLTLIFVGSLYYFADPEEEYHWWVNLVDALPFQGNDQTRFVILAQLAFESVFWFLTISITTFERLGVMERFRLQSIPENPEQLKRDAELTKEAAIGVLISHFITRPVMLYLLFPIFQLRMGSLRQPVPSMRTLLVQLFWCMIIDDTWFYWMHRLFHEIPFLYKHVHKQHHRFTRPNIFATEYAHPIEDLIVNGLGTIIGPLILGTHPFLLVFYPAMKLYQSMEAHSGFNIPFPFSVSSVIDSMDCSCAHDFHHSNFVGNYGGWTMFWDWVCGTDSKYETHVMVKHKNSLQYWTARRPYEHDQRGLVVRQTQVTQEHRD